MKDKKEKLREYSDFECPFCGKEADRDTFECVEMYWMNGKSAVNRAMHKRCAPEHWRRYFCPFAIFEVKPQEFSMIPREDINY